MTGDHLHETASLLAANLLADDALVDALAHPAGIPATLEQGAESDPLASLLRGWRNELDTAADAVGTPACVLPASTTSTTRRRAAHRRATRTLPRSTAAAVGLVVALAGGGVAAAAASGPNGPLGALHRVLFGQPSTTDPLAVRVAALLDGAARTITAARQAGSIATPARQHASRQLDRAAQLLHGDTSSPERLHDRLAHLRQLLNALPDAPSPTATRTPGARQPATPLDSASATTAAPVRSPARPIPTRTGSRTPATPASHSPTQTAPPTPTPTPPSSAGAPSPTPTPSSTRNGNGGNGGNGNGGGDGGNGGGDGGNGGGDGGNGGGGNGGGDNGGGDNGGGSGAAGSGGNGDGSSGNGNGG